MGSNASIEILELVYGYQRFNPNNPALFIAHGTEDTTVPFTNAEDLKTIWETNEIDFVYYPLEGKNSWPLGCHCEWKKLIRFIF